MNDGWVRMTIRPRRVGRADWRQIPGVHGVAAGRDHGHPWHVRRLLARLGDRQGILTQIGTALEIAYPMTRQDTLAGRMAARGFAMLRGYLAP